MLVWLQFATALLSIHVVILRTLIKQMPKILNWEIFAKENAFLTDLLQSEKGCRFMVNDTKALS